MKKTFSYGFTLVELAIVLIVVGLLVGGILAGQDLIKQAQIRNVMSQFREYDTALNTFRAKYNNQIPGDFSMASVFGVNLSPSTGNPNVYETWVDADFNGDNDGTLETNLDGAYDFDYLGEMVNFWIHLSNLNLIKGMLSHDTACVMNCSPLVGRELPSAAIGVGMVILTDLGHSNRLFYVLGINESIEYISNGEGDAIGPAGDNLTPEQAYSFDIKLDDGKPDTGDITVIKRYIAGYFEIDDSLAADDCFETAGGDYNLSVTTKVCTIAVKASS